MNQLLVIDNLSVRTDADGRYCLNDLHKAAGGENKHRPSLWAENQQTQELISAMEAEAGIPALISVKGGNQQGTYVAKELVYAYAMWISPAFHLKVIRAYDALVTQPQPMNPAQLSRMQLIELAMEAERERLVLVERVEVLTPKADALDRIATVSDGSLCLRDAAKELQMQPKQFNLWMQANKWIYKRAGGSNFIGYQDRIQSGLLEHKANIVIDEAGNERLRDQVRVTSKGLARLAELLEREAA